MAWDFFSVSMIKLQFTIKHNIIIILSRYVSQSVGEMFSNIFVSFRSYACTFAKSHSFCGTASPRPTVRDFGLGFFFIWSLVIFTLSPGETFRYRRRPLWHSSNWASSFWWPPWCWKRFPWLFQTFWRFVGRSSFKEKKKTTSIVIWVAEGWNYQRPAID